MKTMSFGNDGPVVVTPNREIFSKDVVAGMAIRMIGRHGVSDAAYLVIEDPGEYGHIDYRAFDLATGKEGQFTTKVLDCSGTVRVHVNTWAEGQ